MHHYIQVDNEKHYLVVNRPEDIRTKYLNIPIIVITKTDNIYKTTILRNTKPMHVMV